MKQNRSYTMMLPVSMAAMAATVVPAMAQEEDSDAIVVTARRVEERLQDVPISITAFSQQQLANRNIVSAGDIATYTPSLAANSRFGPEKTSFAIRGFNQDNGTAPSVGVYFADVPALRSIGGTTGGNGAGPGAFFDLQNLQVLKGPQGTLFGRNTSGGAVLLVPQKPTSRLGGYVEASIGNYDLRRVQAVANIPLLDTLRIRLGVDRQTRSGYMKNVSGIGPSDFNDIDYTAVRFSSVADLTPNLENYFIATYSKSDTHGFLPRVSVCDRNPPTPNPLSALACNQLDRANNRDFYTGENGVINPSQRIEQWQIMNTTTWSISDTLTARNIISYGQFREALRGTIYGENLVIQTGPDAGRNALRVFSSPFPNRKNASQSTFTEEFRLQGSLLDDRLAWQAGVYVELSDPLGFSGALSNNPALCTGENGLVDCRSFQAAAGATQSRMSVTARSNKYSFEDYGIYAQGTFKLTDKFSLTAGARYTWDYYNVVSRQIMIMAPVTTPEPIGNCLDTFLFGPAGPSNPRNPGTFTEAQCQTFYQGSSKAPTWVLGLDYKPTDAILVYAKYARGYRQGQVAPQGYGRPAFDPEKIDTYELGLKTSWRGPVRGTFNLAGFYNDFSNQQIATSGRFAAFPTETPAALITNAGKSRIAGVEVDASLSPLRGLTIDAAYAYLDTKVVSIVAPSTANTPFDLLTPSGALVGRPLTFSPKNKFTITGTYVLPLDESFGKISVGATFSHVDSQQVSYQGTNCITGIGNCARSGALGYDPGILPPLDLLNVNINWASVAGSPVDLSLFATNVTKQRYATASFGGYPSFGFDGMSVGEPRAYGVRIRYRFGD